MADSDERLRSIRFPQSLWDAIDRDATRCKRSSVRQMEVVLSIFYGLDNSAVDMEKVRAIPGSTPTHEQGTVLQLELDGKGVAPRSKKSIPLANSSNPKRKIRAVK